MCRTWISSSCSKWKKNKGGKINHLLSASLENDSNILPERFLITNSDTYSVLSRCLLLQVPWSFVLSLCTTAIMKNRQALPLQRPQKPLLTTHERLACSLGEREGAGGEGRSTKREGTPLQEKGHVEARVLSQENSQVPLFLPNTQTRKKV